MSGKLPFWGGVAAGAAGSALAIAGVKYIQGQRQISRDVDAFREHWAEPRAQHPDDGVGRTAFGRGAGLSGSESHRGANTAHPAPQRIEVRRRARHLSGIALRKQIAGLVDHGRAWLKLGAGQQESMARS